VNQILVQFLDLAKKRQIKNFFFFFIEIAGIFQNIPKKIAIIIDLKSILISRGHDMIVIEKRKACFGCKILDRTHPPKKNTEGARQWKILRTRNPTFVRLMEAAVNVMHLYAFTVYAGRFITMRRNIYSYLEYNWCFKVAFLRIS
jgi:hypothetical protein